MCMTVCVNRRTEPREGRCASCRYYDPFSGVCCNKLSDRRTEFMPSSSACDEYTAIEEDEE